MDPFAITLVVTSALLHAVRDFLTKKAKDTRSFMWLFTATSIVLYFPFFVYYWITIGPPSGPGVAIAIFAGLVIHGAYWLSLSKTYEEGDLSHVYPIVRSSPAFVLLFGVLFFAEEVTTRGVMGILLVVCGAYLVNMKRLTFRELLDPLRSVATDKTTQYAVFTLLTVTAYSLADKQGVAYLHPFHYLYIANLLSIIPFTPYIFSTRTPAQIASVWRTNMSSIIFNGIFGFLSYGLILVAFTFSNASYVVGLRQISIVFAVLLGSHVLREDHKAIRLAAALIIFAGAFLISIA